MSLSILDALEQSKPKESEKPRETDVNKINDGFSFVSDVIFKDILVKCRCSKAIISDCFELYDESHRDGLIEYFKEKVSKNEKN